MKLADRIVELEKYITDAKEADDPDNVFSGISRALMAMARNWKRDVPFSKKQVEFASTLLQKLMEINEKNCDENQKGLQVIPEYEKTINDYKEWFKNGYENGTIKQDKIMPFKRSFWKNPMKSLDEGRGTRLFEMINRHLTEFTQTAANVYRASAISII